MLMTMKILNQFKSEKGERKPGHSDLKLLLTELIILWGFWVMIIDVSAGGGGDNYDNEDDSILNCQFKPVYKHIITSFGK